MCFKMASKGQDPGCDQGSGVKEGGPFFGGVKGVCFFDLGGKQNPTRDSNYEGETVIMKGE